MEFDVQSSDGYLVGIPYLVNTLLHCSQLQSDRLDQGVTDLTYSYQPGLWNTWLTTILYTEAASLAL